MSALLDLKLVFVTGKGGTGKTTVASALALLASTRGKKVLICEVDGKGDVAGFYEARPTGFDEEELLPGLFAMTMDTEASLREYLKLHLKIPIVGRIGPLAKAFDFVATAAPGVREILTVGKLCYEVRERHYDLVKVGLIRSQTDWMLDILSDHAQTGLVAVTTPEEMPVNETLELTTRVKEETTVRLSAVVVNRVLPELFGQREEEVFEQLRLPAADAGAAPPTGRLLSTKEMLSACGRGGVGKTTTAAAVGAMAAAEHGGRVLVLTVDPAKRLADALGLKGIGNQEVRIADEVFKGAGITPRGELWAAMLDTKQSWDDLIRRHAPDAATREKILANPLYKNISGRFVQSHDYIAMERLYEIHSEGKYDLIVVDTPPTRNALDFLDAPQRLADFFSSRLLRWLIAPYRSRLVNVATKPFYTVADRILGTQFLADISEFFILFQSMYAGFVTRSDAVTRLLSDRRTTFMVVSTLEATPLREAEFFSTELLARKLHLGAIVLNKVLPDYLRDSATARLAQHMADQVDELGAGLTDDPT